MKIPLKYVFIPFIIILIVVGGFYLFSNNDETEPTVEIQNVDYDKLDEVIFDVKTSKIIRGELIKSTNANGLLKANKEIEVVSNIAGYINEINVYEGKKVSSGELLIQLDDKEYRIELKEAEDRLIEARVEYGFLTKDTAVDSVGLNAASKIEEQITQLEQDYSLGKVDEESYFLKKDELELKLIFTGAKREELILNKSGFSRAVNAKERARLNLAYTKIMAPFGGVIGDFDLVVGQRVNSGVKLFKLLDVSKLRIDVGVLESEIVNIAKGNRVQVKVNAFPGKHFEGKVVFISPFIDTENKTCKVTIELSNPHSDLKPGMFAQVNIEIESLEDRVLIPEDALLIRDRRSLVFVVEDDLAKWKYVTIGEQNDEYIEIIEGINVGEDVIIEGHYTLAHDARVQIRN